jgi:hypothetical protein
MVTSALSLSHYLAHLVAQASCFCCDSPTDLMMDAEGRLLVHCPRCGAEISAEETVRGLVDERVLRAA